ncbi:MAG: SPOR domain-containing protein [Gammaproteobacteria bacterium]|nr:SPOR domain-containing protein [Gammaproteobacteria bacterium]
MKERLTGAIILVALIVLLVPELLTGPVRSAARAAAVASSTEEPPLRSYTIKLTDEAHNRGASAHAAPEQPAPIPPAPAASPPPPAAATAAASPAAEEGTASPAPAPPSAPATHTPAAVPAGPASAPGSTDGAATYMVQLGSFASRANADRLAKHLRAQGFPVSVSQGSPGRLYRVRVGPAHDRAAAGDLAQQLRAHGHGDGKIVPK